MKKNASLTLDGHVGTVTSLAYNPTKSNLYSGGFDHSVRVWDLDTASNTNSMNCECTVLSLDHSLKSQLLVSGHSDNVIRIWDPRSQGDSFRNELNTCFQTANIENGIYSQRVWWSRCDFPDTPIGSPPCHGHLPACSCSQAPLWMAQSKSGMSGLRPLCIR